MNFIVRRITQLWWLHKQTPYFKSFFFALVPCRHFRHNSAKNIARRTIYFNEVQIKFYLFFPLFCFLFRLSLFICRKIHLALAEARRGTTLILITSARLEAAFLFTPDYDNFSSFRQNWNFHKSNISVRNCQSFMTLASLVGFALYLQCLHCFILMALLKVTWRYVTFFCIIYSLRCLFHDRSHTLFVCEHDFH